MLHLYTALDTTFLSRRSRIMNPQPRRGIDARRRDFPRFSDTCPSPETHPDGRPTINHEIRAVVSEMVRPTRCRAPRPSAHRRPTTVTNAQGPYRLTPLPIGTYLVTYALPGFQTVKQQALRLEIGMQAKLDVVLKVGTIAETVTVSGAAPVVDVTSAASTQFTCETLELTPTARNGLISLGAQAPGVRGRVDVGGGNVGDPPEFKTFWQTLVTPASPPPRPLPRRSAGTARAQSRVVWEECRELLPWSRANRTD